MLNTNADNATSLQFFKYQGAGNDFILFDNRSGKYSHLDEKSVKRLCDRHFGIGADGLMLLQAHAGFDFEMLYFNADGKPGTMCGNGGRCIVAFAKHLGIISQQTEFLAVDGPHFARISEEGNQVDLQMIDVQEINQDGEAYVLNTGSPHYIKQVKNLEQLDVYTEGKAIRNSERYQAEGINVNFIEDQGDHLFVRTFERGVEDETFACGTGVTAAALSIAKHHQQSGNLSTAIRVLGGLLRIDFLYHDGQFSEIFLCGPAELVFQGEIKL